MNPTKQNTSGQNLALLAELYALLCDLLTAYFTPPLISDADKLRRIYSALYTSIDALLVKPGMEYIRIESALPYKSLPARGPIAETEWENTYRRQIIETLAMIEQQYYAAGSPELPDGGRNSDLIDEVKKALKKYVKTQKKALKKSGGTVLSETPVPTIIKEAGDTSTLEATKTETRYVVEKEPEKKTSIWKTVVIGIVIGIITGTVARLIVYFITRYLE